VLVAPVTVAVNCAVWDGNSVVAKVETLTATRGETVTVAVALLVVSAALVAVMVTLVTPATLAGAV